MKFNSKGNRVSFSHGCGSDKLQSAWNQALLDKGLRKAVIYMR